MQACSPPAREAQVCLQWVSWRSLVSTTTLHTQTRTLHTPSPLLTLHTHNSYHPYHVNTPQTEYSITHATHEVYPTNLYATDMCMNSPLYTSPCPALCAAPHPQEILHFQPPVIWPGGHLRERHTVSESVRPILCYILGPEAAAWWTVS